jgi:hypothetical protein
MAQRLTRDTTLPICDAAKFFDVTSQAQRSDPLTPEYEVYALLDHCPVKARLDALTAQGQAVLVTPAGFHVTIMPGPGQYDIRVWHAAGPRRH